MRYWDSSALLPLIVREAASKVMAAELDKDPAVATWWGTAVECASAIARLEREELLDHDDATAALARIRAAAATWAEVPANPPVRDQAIRMLRLHRLRASDAIQIAAAIVAADFQPATVPFVTLDMRQRVAAEREGFTVVTPT